MPETGWLSPSTVVDNNAVGTLTWANPGNAAAQDDTYASVTGQTNAQSHYLKATGFGAAIPAGATPNGIEVGFDAYRSGGMGTPFTVVRLVLGGVVSGDNKAAGSFPTGDTDTYTVFGGVADLWGLSPTEAALEASDFGVVLSVNMQGSGAFSAYVDLVRVRITYTEAAAGGMAPEQAVMVTA
jgi:hypothetical protein